VEADLVLLVDDRDAEPGAAEEHLPRDRQPDDPGADDREVSVGLHAERV
jgi:hypothetical protein